MGKAKLTVKLVFFLLLNLIISLANAIDVQVNGISGAPANNISAYLQSVTIDNPNNFASYQDQIENYIQDALKAFGYYQPKIDFHLQNQNHLIVDVEPGLQVIVDQLTVKLEGPGNQDPVMRQAIASASLTQDLHKPLIHAHYINLKSRLTTLALQRGYFDADFTMHRIEVMPWQQKAAIYLTFATGQRYRFGEIRYSSSQIRSSTLVALRPFQPNDFYLTDDIALYNKRLSDSGWFRSVSVLPVITTTAKSAIQRPSIDDSTQPTTADPNHYLIPVNVNLIPADKHHFDVGLGYTTDLGPRFQFTWNRPWVNSRGDSWKNNLYFSKRRQRLAGLYKMPTTNPLRSHYELAYGFEYLDDNNTRSTNGFFTPTKVWRFDNHWIQQLYFRVSHDRFKQADQTGNITLYTPGMHWSYTAVDNLQFPRHGNRQDISLEGTLRQIGSGVSYLQATWLTQWITSFGDDNRLYARANLGVTQTSKFSQLPPILRFFAGGDNSVRGYSYETLAPRNAQGQLLGGKNMIAATLEYQRHITGNWWAATFVDAGNAFDGWKNKDLKRSAGVGALWVSPVGPIRFYVAHPFDDKETSWRIHFAIGPEF